MSQTMHDVVQAALIQKAIDECDFEVYEGDFYTPENYQRMWKKITGKDISLKEADKALKEGKI